jgi:hypothetical protein
LVGALNLVTDNPMYSPELNLTLGLLPIRLPGPAQPKLINSKRPDGTDSPEMGCLILFK